MTTADPASRSPNAVDVAIGRKVRARRNELRVTQTSLANAIGKTFQQIQKYEKGRNRVSASVLWEIACQLKVPIQYFFTDIPVESGSNAARGEGSREQRLTELFCALNKHEQEAMMQVIGCLLQSRT